MGNCIIIVIASNVMERVLAAKFKVDLNTSLWVGYVDLVNDQVSIDGGEGVG